MTVNTNGPKTGREATLEMLESMHPAVMTNGEMLAELVLGQREMRKLVKQFVESMEKNPMLATMGKMMSGKRT